MASLQVLKQDNNITFLPAEILQSTISSPPNESILPGIVDMTVTAHIKGYLRQVANVRTQSSPYSALPDFQQEPSPVAFIALDDLVPLLHNVVHGR